MTLRLMGALLLAGGAAAAGFSAAAGLERRARVLRGLLEALELMEREIAFQLTPVPMLLERLAERAAPTLREFFLRCRAGLDRLGEQSFADIWTRALEETPLGLAPRELDTLRGLGGQLGRCDGEGQQELLKQARLQLAQDLRRAEEEREKQGRMYRVLGVTAGALLAIVLL